MKKYSSRNKNTFRRSHCNYLDHFEDLDGALAVGAQDAIGPRAPANGRDKLVAVVLAAIVRVATGQRPGCAEPAARAQSAGPEVEEGARGVELEAEQRL